MNIQGAIALVTGANGGIGKYYVQALRELEAAKIYVCARKIESLTELTSSDPKRIIPIGLDITDKTSIEATAAQCSDVTLLINNAGISFNQKLIDVQDLSNARAEMEINYFGTLEMCRAFAPILKQNGGGAIINMLSILGLVNFPLNSSYSASKAAAFSLTQGVRAELTSQKTLVVAVLPGTVDTEMSKYYPPPKVSPSEVVSDALQAVINEIEEVYPGEQAKEMLAQLTSNPKLLEKQMAESLNYQGDS